jgi:TP53 regulating kinase and related kinases
MKTLISQGAEAKIFLDKQIVSKDRIPKSYRHPELDRKIRTRRTRSESKILTKALEAGANIPKVITTEKFNLEIEYIKGDRLSETLNSYQEKKQFELMRQLGKQTAILHKNNLIHGDLTTSNIILKEGKIFVIDFGLGFVSTKIEDKAVDLHLIKQALEAKHFQNHKDLFTNFLKGYKYSEAKGVIERLEIVEKRGRYKH